MSGKDEKSNALEGAIARPLTDTEEDAAFDAAHAVWKPLKEAREAAEAAQEVMRQRYLADPEVIAAFDLLKRKQAAHGLTEAESASALARRAERRAWDRVERLFPDLGGI